MIVSVDRFFEPVIQDLTKELLITPKLIDGAMLNNAVVVREERKKSIMVVESDAAIIVTHYTGRNLLQMLNQGEFINGVACGEYGELPKFRSYAQIIGEIVALTSENSSYLREDDYYNILKPSRTVFATGKVSKDKTFAVGKRTSRLKAIPLSDGYYYLIGRFDTSIVIGLVNFTPDRIHVPGIDEMTEFTYEIV